MLIDRLRDQIGKAERRYRDHAAERREKEHELGKIDAGRISDVNFDVLEGAKRLVRRIALSAMTREGIAQPAGTRSNDNESPVTQSVLLERIIKSNDLVSASFLIEGARVRRCVGRIVIRSSSGTPIGFGTGSLVSPRLLLTNNHVLDTIDTAANSTVQFDYVDSFDGSPMETVEFVLEPQTFFVTDEPLDYSLVAVTPKSLGGVDLSTRGWVPLIPESGKAIVGERVSIIQHPGGEPQQIAIEQNRIIDVVGDFLHYETDTRQGSSGSPVSNRAWQTAALHHAGVPRRKDGKILLRSGAAWDGKQATVGQIDWIANEGTRISRVVDSLEGNKALVNANQLALLSQVFDAPPRHESASLGGGAALSEQATEPRLDDQGRLVYTVPVEIAVGVPGAAGVAVGRGSSVAGAASDAPSSALPADTAPKSKKDISPSDLQAAQAALRAHESSEYYDAAVDEAAIDRYYDGIAERTTLVGQPLFEALSERLRVTHKKVLSYKNARLEHLYPWIDLHPDRKLRSIYSGEGFDAEEVVRADLEVEAARESMLARFAATEAGKSPEAMEQFLETLEAAAPFNCEHVVPQSWFGKRQPMKADLHHLFTCESDCNSFRSNIPYFEFPPEDEARREKCGRRETNDRFEPSAGKGPVARATLYFLLRYVGMVGDAAREMQAVRLPILMKWHDEDPVGEYERHRNAAIYAVQGNRNPLIDFPDWAEHIDFNVGFGGVG